MTNKPPSPTHRKYYSIGKLNPSHQANVTCIAVDKTPENENLVVTGSKDHLIKVFQHPEETAGLISPVYTGTPHLDGRLSFFIIVCHRFSSFLTNSPPSPRL